MALLLHEGAIKAVTTNWDTCIETAVPDEPISAVVTDEDRLLYVGARLYKLHGDARRPGTLLISTNQMADPLAWASADVASALGNATVVFLGIGDVAPYVRLRLDYLLSRIGNTNHVRLVGRSIRTNWAASAWSTLLPEFPEVNRIEQDADAFTDELLRAWARACILKAKDTATGIGEPMSGWFDRLVSTLGTVTAPEFVGLMRRARSAETPRSQSIQAPPATDALLGLAAFARGRAIMWPADGATLPLDGEALELLIGDGHVSGSAGADEARDRIARRRREGVIGPDELATVICSGFKGPVAPKAGGLEADIVAATYSGDLIDGPTAGPTRVVRADDLIDEAAA